MSSSCHQDDTVVSAPPADRVKLDRPRNASRDNSHRIGLGRRLTAPLRVLPDFLILGGQKCGTTTLYDNLIRHPSIVPSKIKEVHFFDNHFDKGVLWYRSHFPTRLEKRKVAADSGHFITGEGSPYYLFHPLAPQRVHDTLPGARLIVMLRNPVERAYSHYQHEVRRGRETLSFEEAIAAEPERLAGEAERLRARPDTHSFNHQHFSYLARGRYMEQLEAWTALFPREQFLVLTLDDLIRDPVAAYAQTFAFLGVAPVDLGQLERSNVGRYAQMSAETRARLTEHFRPHNERLYAWLGRDLGW